jgi:CBS domain containing-hemolysin-like protein
MSVWIWTVLTVLLLANALYVAAEFAAVGVRRSRIQRLAEDGNMLARRLAPFLSSPARLDRYVGVSQIGITLSSLMLGAYAQATVSVALVPLAADWFQLTPSTALSATTIAVLVVLTSVQLVVGELVPKALALQHPTGTALATVLPMRLSLVVFRPLIGILNGTALLLLRLLGSTEQAHRHLHSPEEIDLLIAESRDGGLLELEEQQRLRRALRLGLRKARDLMVPRHRLTMLSTDMPWAAVVRIVTTSPFSRLPVYRGSNQDDIAGLLRVKDLVERYVAEGPVQIERLVRPFVRIAEDTAADRVVTELRERRAHSAIVIDAAGRLVGLITMQDVLGELLGAARPSVPGPQPGAGSQPSS